MSRSYICIYFLKANVGDRGDLTKVFYSVCNCRQEYSVIYMVYCHIFVVVLFFGFVGFVLFF